MKNYIALISFATSGKDILVIEGDLIYATEGNVLDLPDGIDRNSFAIKEKLVFKLYSSITREYIGYIELSDKSKYIE